MSKKTWILTDRDEDLYVPQITLGPERVGGRAQGYCVSKRTLRAGLSQGVDVIEVDNGRLRLIVVPTRGMGLWKGVCGDVPLGWQSPVKGPVHPAFVPLSEPLGFLQGFDEFLCRCGLESNGAPEFDAQGRLRYGLHGKIANLPAHQVQVAIDGDSGEITVSGTVDEARLFGVKLRLHTSISTHVGQNGFAINDTVQNLSQNPSPLELFYHVNLGAPLLAPGCIARVPVRKVVAANAAAAADLSGWNHYGPYLAGQPEVVFLCEPAAAADGQTRAVLRNAAGDRGVSVKFNSRQMPCFTLWKSRQSLADGYVTGFEPGINYPNPRSFEEQAGRVATLAPGQSRSFALEIEAHTEAAAVQAAESAVTELQGGIVPEMLSPTPPWTAG